MTDVIIAKTTEEISDWKEALHCTGNALFEKGYVKDTFAEACIEREKVFPTGLPSEEPVAIPHADGEHVLQSALCVLRLDKPVTFKRMDVADETIDTRLIVNMAIGYQDSQVTMLKKLINMLKSKQDVDYLLTCTDEELLEFVSNHVNQEEEDS